MKTAIVLAASFLSLVCDILGENLDCTNVRFKHGSPSFRLTGYCWNYSTFNYTISLAENTCAYYKARLPAINSNTKADKLARYVRASRNSWIDHFKNGEGKTIWLSTIRPSGGEMIWDATGLVVSDQAKDSGEPIMQNGKACVVFSYETMTWAYANCNGKHTVICEELGHEYADEEPDETAETIEEAIETDQEETSEDGQKAQSPDTEAYSDDEEEPVYDETDDYTSEYEEEDAQVPKAEGKCAKNYTYCAGRCFLLGDTSVDFHRAEQFCTRQKGSLVQINNAEEEQLIIEFLADYLDHGYGVWLEEVIPRGRMLFWKKNMKKAAYVTQEVSQYFNPMRSRFLFVSNPELDGGRLHRCQGRRRCIKRPLCEANQKQ